MPTPARADLHVHSKHSNRPAEWLLQQLRAPECYTEPMTVYRACRARGHQFVTLSDHDTLAGALEIAHLPGAFLSSEVTVTFPDDGCAIHCLVLGVSEAQHREIQRLRRDVYAFRDYCRQEDVVVSVAHPLYRVNNCLTLDHLEQLLVLFPRFETRNGIHDRHLNEMAELLLGALTPEILAELAERHDLEPWGAEPWRKSFTGGSDDHGGLYLGTAYTETPPAATVEEYLGHLRAGRHAPGGESGSSRRLAQSLLAIADRYFVERFGANLWNRRDPFAQLLRRLGRPPEAHPIRRWFRQPALEPGGMEQRTLARANQLCAEIVETTTTRVFRALQRGEIHRALTAVSGFAPLALAVAPYAVAVGTQYKDDALIAAAARRFPCAGLTLGRPRKGWVTDTLTDVNGVARSIRAIGTQARQRGRELVTLTCRGADEAPPRDAGTVHTFAPLSRFEVPGYPGLTLAVPPLLDVLDHIERERYGELIISTPGPMGLAALAAARWLGIPTTGIYHTDFPLYVRHLAGPGLAEDCAWGLMRWFFGSMDRLYVPSRWYGDQLAAHGFDRERIALMPRGVDAEGFHPRHRETGYFRRYGLTGRAHTLLYVGRISREKNLDLLLAAFERLRAAGHNVELALVGDGPYRAELAERHLPTGVAFTGFLHGEELARAYASADLFAFPSTTDTYGNVVLEAHAAGLPAVVTSLGGPQEIITQRGSGLVAPPTAEGFATALATLLDSDTTRRRAAQRALETARAASWDRLLDRLWGDEPDHTPWQGGHRAPRTAAA